MTQKKFWASYHFWIILVLFIGCTILQYRQSLGILGGMDAALGFTRHVVERIVFLILVFYASIVFGFKFGIGTVVASLIAMIPRAAIISPTRQDAIFETIIITLAGVALCVYNDQLQKYRAKVDVAQEKLQHSNREVKHYAMRLKMLNSISLSLNKLADHKKVIQTTLDIIPKVAEADAVLVYIMDDRVGKLTLGGFHGITEAVAQGMSPVNLGEGLVGKAVATGQAVVVDDSNATLQVAQEKAQIMSLLSQLALPIRYDGKVMGAVLIGKRKPSQFLPEQIDFLGNVTDHVGISLQHALAYESMKKAI